MKIACLGWGSLIWDPGELKIQREWFKDGPILPIEFTRISKDKRMTLVIDKYGGTRPVRVLWALMITNDLEEAKKLLKDREGVPLNDIGSITTKGKDTNGDDTKLIVKNWLNQKGLDVAVWTGLDWKSKNNTKYFKNKRPTAKKVISHLNSLKGEERRKAEYYIRKTPRQIDTIYRRRIEAKFGWTPIDR